MEINPQGTPSGYKIGYVHSSHGCSLYCFWHVVEGHRRCL